MYDITYRADFFRFEFQDRIEHHTTLTHTFLSHRSAVQFGILKG